VANGFLRRRVDQIELVRVKDLYLQQTMMSQWLNVGTVVVVSSELTLPRAALFGIDRPQVVMDLIWQYTRREQDSKTTAIEQV
jgi:Bacterial PH domain